MKDSKRIFCVLCVALLALLLVGCKRTVNVESGAAEQDYPVEVLEVTLGSKPDKVVILSQSLADVALALGYEGQVVGVTAECTQTAYAALPRVEENADSLKSLSPDVVLADADTPENVKSELESAGLKVTYVEVPADRAGFQKMYSEVATIFAGASTGYANGTKVSGDICQTLDDIRRIIPDTDGVLTTAAVLFDLEGNGVAGDSFLNSIMESAGLSNVFSGQTGGYDPAMLRSLNPDYIFCPADVARTLKSDSQYAGLNAVTQDHVVTVDEAELCRMGRTVISLASTMAGSAYPELLEEQSTDPTTSAGQVSYDKLEFGDENDNVYKMQAELYELGFLTVSTYDGYYGYATQDAVKAFQEKNGLEADGVAGEETLRLLYSGTAKGVND